MNNTQMKPPILLVDDSDMVRRATTRLLRHAYEVTTVEDVAAALAALALRPFTAIVSDMEMPEATGLDLYEKVRQDHPHLVDRFILYTGAPEKAEGKVPCIVDKGSNPSKLMQALSGLVYGGDQET